MSLELKTESKESYVNASVPLKSAMMLPQADGFPDLPQKNSNVLEFTKVIVEKRNVYTI